MFKTLLIKEITSHVLTLRFGVTFSLILILVFAGFYFSVQEYTQRLEEYSVAQKNNDAKIDRIQKHPEIESRKYKWLFWWDGVTRAVSPPPLACINSGLSRVWAKEVHANSSESSNVGDNSIRNGLFDIFQTPNMIYVVNIVLSFLALLFVFDGVCGEKEAGTLRLMLSYSIPRHLVLTSKWVAGYIVLLLPFAIAFVGGVGYACVKGALTLSPENLKLVAFLFVVALVYFAVFFSLGLFISSVTHKATTSLLACLFVWVVWVLVIPNMSPVLSRILAPIPSKRKIEAEKKAVDQEQSLRQARVSMLNGWDDRGKAMNNEIEEIRAEGERQKREWDGYYRKAQERQAGLSETLGRISPSSSWIFSAAALTQTGRNAYMRLIEARTRFQSNMESKADQYYDQENKNHRLPPANDIPQVKMVLPNANEAVATGLNDILLLVVWNAVLFMAAFMSFLRYDVR